MALGSVMMSFNSTPLPKYYRLYETIRQQIAQGELPANVQLPTEEELCNRYAVSRGTVRKAFDVLVNEGLIRREQGRGNFVNPPKLTLGTFALAESTRQPTQTRKLALDMLPANAEVAARLELNVGEPVIHVVQLQMLNDIPIMLEKRYLAQALCANLLNEDIETQSLHWLLIHKYKLPLVRVTHTIEARNATTSVAKELGIPVGSSTFYIDRLTYTTHEDKVRPAVWYRALCRGDHYQFKAEFLSSL
jgi:GntR family transcriptional regulator